MKNIVLKVLAVLGLTLVGFVGMVGFSVWLTATLANAQGLPPCCAPAAPLTDLPVLNDDELMALSYTDLKTGQPDSLAAQSTEPFLMVFFASWCVSCVEEAPVLRALQASGIAVFLVNGTDSQETALKWVETHAPTVRAGLLNPEEQAMQRLDVVALPTTILFGTNLQEQARWEGKASFETLQRAWNNHN